MVSWKSEIDVRCLDAISPVSSMQPMTDAIILINDDHETTLGAFLELASIGTGERAVRALDVGDSVTVDDDRVGPVHIERIA